MEYTRVSAVSSINPREQEALLMNAEEGTFRSILSNYDATDDDAPCSDVFEEAPVAESTAEMLLNLADNVTETITEELQHVKEVITDVVIEVAHTLDELQHPSTAVDDDGFVMGITRAHSLLPGDIAQAAAVVEPEPRETQFPDTASLSLTDADSLDTMSSRCLDEVGKNKSYDSLESESKVVVEDPKHLVGDTSLESAGLPMSAYFLLGVAVFGLSSIGPLLNVQNDVDPTLKIVWRNSATSVALFPLALYSVVKEGFPVLTPSQVIVLLLTGASYAAWTVFFSWSLQYTTIGNAVMLGNCQAILLLVGRAVMGEAISLTEGVGAVVAFSGAVLCSRDSASGEDTLAGNSSLLGDGYAIICAIAGVVYLVTAKTVRPSMNLYSFMFCVMFLAAVDALILAYMAGIQVSWDRNLDRGAFGWMNLESDRLPLEMVMIISCQFFGAMGYIRCMAFFSNLVISVATLLEPVVAEITAVLLGVGSLPGWMGWLGNGLVIVGTLAVVYRPPSLPQKALDH